MSFIDKIGVSPTKSEVPFEPLESLLSGSSEFNNLISYSSLMKNKSAQSSPMKTNGFNKTVHYDNVSAKTLTYEVINAIFPFIYFFYFVFSIMFG